MFEGDDQTPFEEEQPVEESSNRIFYIGIGILGFFLCVAAGFFGYYAVKILPQQSAARDAQQATLVEQDVQVGQTLTALAQFDVLSQTPAATATLQATATPPFAQASPTGTLAAAAAASTSDPQTATVAAALTQAAQAQLTVTFLPTSTALPTSGFADQAGLPGLVAMAIALVVVILLARRLRVAPTTR